MVLVIRQLLQQVAEDLETISEQEAWSALAFLEGLDEVETGSTLILKSKGTGAAAAEPAAEESQAADKVDDFLDFLMSAPADTGSNS